MLIAILLTVLGLLLMKYSFNLISHKPFAKIINILWLGLLIGGFYCFWQINYLIVLILVVLIIFLMLTGLYLESQTTKAIKICKIYKQLKLSHPLSDEQDILQSTARLYFQKLRWDKNKIDMNIELIGKSKEKDIKYLISTILIFENPNAEDGMKSYEEYRKYTEKRDHAIDKAYNKIFK